MSTDGREATHLSCRRTFGGLQVDLPRPDTPVVTLVPGPVAPAPALPPAPRHATATADVWRDRVLDAVDDDREAMVALLAAMVQEPSVGGSDEENSAQARLATLLGTDGLEVDHWQVPLAETLARPDFPGVEVDRREAWGLVGRLPGVGDGPALMLQGHIDVVPAGPDAAWRDGAPFSGQVVDGELHGRGACDMKGGLVAAVWAVRALRRAGVPLRGDVLLASVQGEEDGGLGSYAMLERGWTADACVVPEPTSMDVVPANAGALTFRLLVPGLATHASRRLDGVSALEKLWPVWQALQRLEMARNLDVDPLMRRWELPYPISLGTVRGGVWASSVPDLVQVEGRLGVALGEPVEQARAALETAVAEACTADPWLRAHPVQVQWWGGQFAPGRTDPDSFLVHGIRAARARSGGPAAGVPGLWGAPYGSDLRLLVGAGIPTVQFGPGDAGLAHSTQERVPLAEVLAVARTLAVLAVDTCGTS